MGIWERLGTVIKSYLNEEDSRINWRGGTSSGRRDPDLDSAYEELDDYLKGSDSKWSQEAGEKDEKEREEFIRKKRPVPEEVRRAFSELGLQPDATFAECKEAYKNLLKVHHPDRHAKHDGNMKKATEKTSRVNAAYERLTVWFKA